MLQSITSKQEETSNISYNTNETPKENSSLIETEEITGTPFHIVTDKQQEQPIYFLVMGDYRLTEPTESREKTLERLFEDHWKIIVTVIAIVVEKYHQRHDNMTVLKETE